jgi:hypothetical protein
MTGTPWDVPEPSTVTRIMTSVPYPYTSMAENCREIYNMHYAKKHALEFYRKVEKVKEVKEGRLKCFFFLT